MKIAICDDEEYFVQTIQQYLWNESAYQIDTFFNPNEMLNQYKKGLHYDVIFCDIVMKPYNGIELARRIRKYDKGVILVFLTAYLDYAPQGYEVDAFRYLLKPIQKEALYAIMEDIHRKQQKQKKILLETAVGTILTPQDSIIYAKAHDKETKIVSEKDTFFAKAGLIEIENMLPSHSFFRIHRKYLIQLSHVTEYDDTRLTLDIGKTLPISRRRSKAFHQAIKTFIQGDKL